MSVTANPAQTTVNPPWRTHVAHSAHVRDLPVVEAGMTQIGRGVPVISSMRAEGPDANIVRMLLAPRAAGHAVPGQGWTALFAPISWTGDFAFNGWNAHKGDVVVITSQLGCHAIGENRDNLSVGLRTDLLLCKIGALIGVPPEDLSLPDMRLSPGALQGHALRQNLIRILQMVCGDGQRGGVLNAAIEQELYEVVAAFLATHLPASRHFAHGHTSSRAVVRTAVNTITASSRPILLSELCAATGVGRTRLFESFSAELSMSPASYIRNARLTDVRDMLANAEAPPRSVKDAMLKHGVVNGGRFASDYRKLFGEYPSQTLSLAREACRAR